METVIFVLVAIIVIIVWFLDNPNDFER